MTAATFLVMLAVSGQPAPGSRSARSSGSRRSVRFDTVAADGSLTVGDKAVPAGEWYSVRRAGRPLPPWPRAPHAELTGGDRVAGTVVGGRRRRPPASAGSWRRAGASSFASPCPSLRAVWLTTRPADDPDPAWLAAPRKRDLFLARNGDSAAGALTAIDAARNAVRYQADGKDRRLELSKLAAIAFNTDLARVRRPKGPYYRLTLADGTRLGRRR